MKRLLFVFVIAALAGCANLPKPSPRAAVYDFGLSPPSQTKTHLNVSSTGMTAAPGLDTADIRYRLAYQDASRVYAYTESRWAATVPELFVSRLLQRIDFSQTGSARCTLHLELQSFDQVFDSPQSSRAVVRLAVELGNGRTSSSQQTVQIEQPAESADARGGVAAMISASDKAIDQLAALVDSSTCPR